MPPQGIAKKQISLPGKLRALRMGFKENGRRRPEPVALSRKRTAASSQQNNRRQSHRPGGHQRHSGHIPLECGDMSPLFTRQTCLPVPKRGHVRTLRDTPQNSTRLAIPTTSWTAPAKRSGDGAFARTREPRAFECHHPHESGVALRFPPQSMTLAIKPFVHPTPPM
jgi:hypothetical protein